MPIWKFIPAAHGEPNPTLLHSPAIILSDSTASALLLLQRRLAGHSVRFLEASADGIFAIPTQDRHLAELVTPDWPVSLLSGSLGLPARSIPATLPNIDGLTVTRYSEGELEVELGRMLNDDTSACFALVDGASFPGLAELLNASSLEHDCLFRGMARDDASTVAPWIIRIGSDDPVSRRWLERRSASQVDILQLRQCF